MEESSKQHHLKKKNKIKKLKILINFIAIDKLFQHSCLPMCLFYQFAFKCNFVYFLICSLRIKIKTLMYVHFNSSMNHFKV